MRTTGRDEPRSRTNLNGFARPPWNLRIKRLRFDCLSRGGAGAQIDLLQERPDCFGYDGDGENLTLITGSGFVRTQSFGLQVCGRRSVDLRTNEGS
jgi:hypothetical protein